MKNKAFTVCIDKMGCISLPIKTMKEMGINIGDELIINYDTPTEIIEKCIKIQKSLNHCDLDDYLCIPRNVMNECGLDTSATLHVMCFDQEITITSSHKMLKEVPKVILQLCRRLGISDEQIATALAEGCTENG